MTDIKCNKNIIPFKKAIAIVQTLNSNTEKK
jgi:hypothetical protein